MTCRNLFENLYSQTKVGIPITLPERSIVEDTRYICIMLARSALAAVWLLRVTTTSKRDKEKLRLSRELQSRLRWRLDAPTGLAIMLLFGGVTWS